MANHVNRNNFDENAEDIHNDVSQLADTLRKRRVSKRSRC